MELVMWLIGSEVALTVAAVAALAFTSLAIPRDVSQRRSCRLLLPIGYWPGMTALSGKSSTTSDRNAPRSAIPTSVHSHSARVSQDARAGVVLGSIQSWFLALSPNVVAIESSHRNVVRHRWSAVWFRET
jgi:hypothetical protein